QSGQNRELPGAERGGERGEGEVGTLSRKIEPMPWRRSALAVRTRVKRNRAFRALHLLLLLGMWFPAAAKCPTGTLTVAGEVPTEVRGELIIRVSVETAKGTFEESTTPAQPTVKIIVSFSTLSSYSPLRGHRCNNRPKTVVITALLDGK